MSPEVKAIYSGIVALVAVWFWLWSIVDSSLGDQSRFASGNKALWAALSTLVPILGGVLYLVLGRNFYRPQRGAE